MADFMTPRAISFTVTRKGHPALRVNMTLAPENFAGPAAYDDAAKREWVVRAGSDIRDCDAVWEIADTKKRTAFATNMATARVYGAAGVKVIDLAGEKISPELRAKLEAAGMLAV